MLLYINCLDPFSILDQQQKQTIPFSGGRCMGEFDGRIFVTTSRDVYYLLAIPVEKQVCVHLYSAFNKPFICVNQSQSKLVVSVKVNKLSVDVKVLSQNQQCYQ